jgi:hypothetical protein
MASVYTSTGKEAVEIQIREGFIRKQKEVPFGTSFPSFFRGGRHYVHNLLLVYGNTSG